MRKLRSTVYILSTFGLCGSIGWFVSNPDWEPGIGILTSLSTLLALLVSHKNPAIPEEESLALGSNSTPPRIPAQMTVLDFLAAVFGDAAQLSARGKLGLSLLGMFACGIAGLSLYPEETVGRFYLTSDFLRAMLSPDIIALDSTARQQFGSIEAEVRRKLQRELDLRGQPIGPGLASQDRNYNSWTLSQIILALPAEGRKHKDAMLQRMDYWLFEDGTSWREFEKDTEKRTPVLGWTIWAQAHVYQKVNQKALKALLRERNQDDAWWGIYFGTNDIRFASTYATAVATIALSSVLEVNSIPVELRRESEEALDDATRWLLDFGENGTWKDYPYNREIGKPRDGISGMVIFALGRAAQVRRISPPELNSLNRAYLAALRTEKLTPTTCEVAGVTVPGNRIDHVRVYVRSSQLLGITSAYNSGSLLERARVLSWLRGIAPELSSLPGVTSEHPWIAAEYLYALTRLQEAEAGIP